MVYLQPHCCRQVAITGIFALALATLLWGCSARPQLIVVDQQLADVSDEAIRVEFVVELTNPGDVALELRELSYRLRMDGRTVYDGRRAAQATLPAGGSVQVMMPAVIPIDDHDAASAAQNFQLSGSVSYTTPSVLARMLRDAGMPRPRVGFAHAAPVTWDTPR